MGSPSHQLGPRHSHLSPQGAASDIGIHFYSLSTDLKPDWDFTHVGQPQILAYWINLAKKYHIYPHIIFNTRVVGARWDSTAQCYYIDAENVNTKAAISTRAEILVSANGFLEIPHVPKIAGLGMFKGDLFHSARWKDVPLKGRKVGVIGNGSSAFVSASVASLMTITESFYVACSSSHTYLSSRTSKSLSFAARLSGYCLQYVVLLSCK